MNYIYQKIWVRLTSGLKKGKHMMNLKVSRRAECSFFLFLVDEPEIRPIEID